MRKNIRGVTMVALVVTMIVLLILSAVTVGLIVGKNGLFIRGQMATKEHVKQEAIEVMNSKITGIQIESYTENQKLPNLQYLSDKLCEDIEIEYVEKETKKQASLNKIDVTGLNSIFTKIKKYPYEFEIDEELKLASIDGIRIENKQDTITITKEEYESLKPSSVKQDSLLFVASDNDLSVGERKLNSFNKNFESSFETYLEYDNSNGNLKCKKSGWFMMTMFAVTQSPSNNYSQTLLECHINGVNLGNVQSLSVPYEQNRDSSSLTIYLEKDDIVEFKKHTMVSPCTINNQAIIQIFKI